MTELSETIPGVRLFDLTVFADERGSFCEAFKASRVGPGPWVQWNVSRSRGGVVRGLHLHRRQNDYWHIVSGSATAALVDRRTDSPTFGRSLCVPLCGDRPQTLLIPPGVLHGFRADNDVVLMYLLDREYDPADELGVRWDDPDLRLPAEWYAGKGVTLSPRDAKAPFLRDSGL